MDIRPIRTETDYQAALKAVTPFFDQEPIAGSDDADRFDVLPALIQLFEAKIYPIDPPDLIGAIKFRMEQQGLSLKDLEPFIGPSINPWEAVQ